MFKVSSKSIRMMSMKAVLCLHFKWHYSDIFIINFQELSWKNNFGNNSCLILDFSRTQRVYNVV